MTVTFSENWHYDTDIPGANLAEVVTYISQLPEAGQTHWTPHFATTAWNGANVAAVEVTVPIDIAMPNWANSSAAVAAEQAEWQRFLTALHDHEQGHIDLVHQYLEHIEGHLIGHDSDTAVGVWDHNLAALHEASNHYDLQTDHGASNGTTIHLP